MQREASIDVSELIIGKTTENNHTLIPNREAKAKRTPMALESLDNDASIKFKLPAAR